MVVTNDLRSLQPDSIWKAEVIKLLDTQKFNLAKM